MKVKIINRDMHRCKGDLGQGNLRDGGLRWGHWGRLSWKKEC